jgi:hypothetical protein
MPSHEYKKFSFPKLHQGGKIQKPKMLEFALYWAELALFIIVMKWLLHTIVAFQRMIR